MVAFKKFHTAALISGFSLCSAIKYHPATYIAELEDAHSSDQFHDILASNDIGASPRLTLSNELFNGASFRLHDAHDNEGTLETIKSMDMVKQLWPVRSYKLSDYKVNSYQGPSDEVLEKRDLEPQKDSYITHVMGGVDKLHEQGYLGTGLKISIIDTGIDYTNPWLGGGFGAGFKVGYGRDLVGPEYNGSYNSLPVEGDNPLDQQGHGTHVAGIVGANPGNPYGIIGVVPNATLGIYKVFGGEGATAEDILIRASLLAFDAGSDVIAAYVWNPLSDGNVTNGVSSSIGTEGGWTEELWGIVISRITAKGIPFSVAASNSGENGTFLTNDASSGDGPTAVGSIDNLVFPQFLTLGNYTTSKDTTQTGFPWVGAKADHDFGTGSWPVYATSLDVAEAADACSALPATTPDLSKYVLLVQRGGCDFAVKAANVKAAGAKRLLLYNNAPGQPEPARGTPDDFPVGMVTDTQGKAWIDDLAAGINVTLYFAADADATTYYSVVNNTASGGFMSVFSSWGPTYELRLKPDVSAPGGTILSTWPVINGTFATLSGTSMAQPYIAGCIALLKEIRGKLSPAEITSLLTTTARPLDFNNETYTFEGLQAPVIQQGGGLVNVFAAAYTQTLFNVSNLPFNDTAHFAGSIPILIKNTGTQAVTYTFGHLEGPTVLALDPDSNLPSLFPPEFDDGKATLAFKPETVTIEAGKDAVVEVTLTPPSGLKAVRLPVYEGFVSINGTNDEYFTVPYFGVAANMHDLKLMDTEEGFPFLANSSLLPEEDIVYNASIVINSSSLLTFTLPYTNYSSYYYPTDISYPTFVWNLAMGSRLVRLDCIPKNSNSKAKITNVLGVDTVGSLPAYPDARGWGRHNVTATSFSGQLNDTSLVPEGRYSLLLRALKIFGDQSNAADYESYESAVFEIKYL